MFWRHFLTAVVLEIFSYKLNHFLIVYWKGNYIGWMWLRAWNTSWLFEYEADREWYQLSWTAPKEQAHIHDLVCFSTNSGIDRYQVRSVEGKKVSMFLSVLVHHLKNHKIKFNFMRTGKTGIKHFNDDLKIVICLQGDLLKAPKPNTAKCTDDK